MEVRRGRGATLRFLLVFLFRGHRRVVLGDLVDALLELLDAAPERAGQIRQALGAKQNQYDDENQQQFLIPQTKHGGTPFLLPTTPYTTRRLPTLSTSRTHSLA